MSGRSTEVPLDPNRLAGLIQDMKILPFIGGRLKYSFKAFGVTRKCPNPVDAFPSAGVSVAVRFVDHLGDPEASKLSFTSTLELRLNKSDTQDSMRMSTMRDLKSTTTEGKTKALF